MFSKRDDLHHWDPNRGWVTVGEHLDEVRSRRVLGALAVAGAVLVGAVAVTWRMLRSFGRELAKFVRRVSPKVKSAVSGIADRVSDAAPGRRG